MSNLINNREYRQKILKELIMELHNGKSIEEVKSRFEKLIEGISASEISDMEQNLIMEGMPVEEIQRLCDVHSAVFKGSIEEIHKPETQENIKGHPLHTFKIENEAVKKLIDTNIKKHVDNFKQISNVENVNDLKQDFNLLWDIDKHYKRKENLIFPYLEKYGITAPPKVMWGVDDEIRKEIKEINRMLLDIENYKNIVGDKMTKVLDRILEMVFKEESILFPMAADTLTEDEWKNIYDESDEIGYCLVEPEGIWIPERVKIDKKGYKEDKNIKEGFVKFDTGILSFKELGIILNTLPVDITFIDNNDIVKYFSQTKERIFPRTKAVIGRTVQNCHPPASVHIVNKMLDDFRAGRKDNEDFWIRMGEIYVYIRYFAVRNNNSEYIGTLEVTQNIKPIKEISGEKRLISD
jgi:DUF438 domain-containing protein